MSVKKLSPIIWIGIIILLLGTIMAVLYGQGTLNIGSLTGLPQKKVSRVALTTCPDPSTKEGDFCVYNLQTLEYYVFKDITNKDNPVFVIYGPNVTKTFKSNNWNLLDGTTYKGTAYSLAKSAYFPMKLTYKLITRYGEQSPAFIFDYATAKTIQGSRYVEVELPNSIKIRFNSFNIPDKDLVNR